MALLASVSLAAIPTLKAQQVAASTEDWSNDIVVTAQAGGPALWRIRKGQATVVVMGTVAPLPASQTWTRWRVRREIKRSRSVLIAAEPEAGFVWMNAWRPSRARLLHQPPGNRLSGGLDPATAALFHSAIAAAGQKDDRYEDLRPAIAGMLLLSDWREHAHLTNSSVQSWVAAAARRKGIRPTIIPQQWLLPTLDVVARTGDSDQSRCLSRLISAILREQAHAGDQAEAWAIGDLVQVRASYVPQADCADEIGGDRARRQAAIAQWERLIDAALAKSVQTFAVVDVSTLLRRDGVLARLQAKGATVEVPRETDGAPASHSARE